MVVGWFPVLRVRVNPREIWALVRQWLWRLITTQYQTPGLVIRGKSTQYSRPTYYLRPTRSGVDWTYHREFGLGLGPNSLSLSDDNSREMDISTELVVLATACKRLQASLPALCGGGSMLTSEFLI